MPGILSHNLSITALSPRAYPILDKPLARHLYLMTSMFFNVLLPAYYIEYSEGSRFQLPFFKRQMWYGRVRALYPLVVESVVNHALDTRDSHTPRRTI